MKVEIRNETPGDYTAIREVHIAAFGEADESAARLVELLRDRKKAPIALVAVAGDRVVGHIMFSPITVDEAPEGFRGIGLAPVGVLPEFQNKGIGSMLIHAGLEACRKAGFDVVVVLGHRRYYPRFGFSRAKDYGLTNEYNLDHEFMAMELRFGALQTIKGMVKYQPEFREAEG